MAPDIFTYIYIYICLCGCGTPGFLCADLSLSPTHRSMSVYVYICMDLFLPTLNRLSVGHLSLDLFLLQILMAITPIYVYVLCMFGLMLLLLPPSAHLLSIPSLSISRYRASCILFKKRHHSFLTNFLFFLFFAMLLQCLLCFCCSYICVVFLCNSPLLYVFIRTYLCMLMDRAIKRYWHPLLNMYGALVTHQRRLSPLTALTNDSTHQ